jgi:ABC-type sugar transport system permease subunit
MMGRGGGLQMVMIDVYYQITYQDMGVANALGVISYLLASGAALYYLKTISETR